MKRADLFAFALIFVLAFVLWLFPLFSQSSDLYLIVLTDSDQFTYDLQTAQSLDFSANGHSLTVVIENGSAKVINASCHDQICTHSAAISKEGQSILCAPAKILVRIVAKEASYDGIAH